MERFIDYRSITDMNNVIIRNLYKFPHDIDLIVGIPRSGMLPANLLALYMNKPFTDIDSFIEGKVYSSGERGKFINRNITNKVIIVDDSISSGGAMEKAMHKLEPVLSSYEIKYAAIFATVQGTKKVDIWCETIDYPRVFQWNMFHHKDILPFTCMDIDGVLCQNPPIDDDGEQYINYITHAKPYFVPTVKVDTLVSCRLEKYRPQTETWLAEHNIHYNQLIMLDLPDKETRTKWGKHGIFKGEIYKNSKNYFFIESSLNEAKDICRVSGKQVYCTENFEMIYHNKVLNKGLQRTIDTLRKWIYGSKLR